MKWSIKQIEDNSGQPLQFSEVVDIKSSLLKRETEILDVSPVKLNGTLLSDKQSILAMFTLEAIVTLPSSRTLNPVPYHMNVDVSERFAQEMYVSSVMKMYPDEVVSLIEGYYIDLEESVIDNILLNLPLQVLSDEELAQQELPHGQGWALLTEDAFLEQKQKEAEETIDPRFAGLKALLNTTDQGE
ncbi:DUF177 domain-containing protein [Carnobacteriaceae bacterium zg-ZUI252]|nr:DUF177 domain-containing protein [Carnobacteriaceae bacterium zg-ZUI252]